MWELDYKETEPRRIDAFELWCWRRLLRVPWPAGRSNQFILKEISPGCSLEGLILKLKLQYFGHLLRRADSFEKALMLVTHLKRLWFWERLKVGGEGYDTGWDGWIASPNQWTWVWAISGNWWWTGQPGVLQSMGSQRVGHVWLTELNWEQLKKNRRNIWNSYFQILGKKKHHKPVSYLKKVSVFVAVVNLEAFTVSPT